MSQFSLADVPTKPIENPAATLNYMLSGIFDNREMIDWPDQALSAVWKMSQTKRFRYVRTGGGFAAWRKAQRATNDNKQPSQGVRVAFQSDPHRNRFLARIQAKIRGRRVAALLYERPIESTPMKEHPLEEPEYSTASRRVTQTSSPSPENVETIQTFYAHTGKKTLLEKVWRVCGEQYRKFREKSSRFTKLVRHRLRL